MLKLSLYAAFFVVLSSSFSVAELRGSSSTTSSSWWSSMSSLWSSTSSLWSPRKEDGLMLPPMSLVADDQDSAGKGNGEFASIPNWDHQLLDRALHDSNVTWRGEGGEKENVQGRRLQFLMSKLEKNNGKYVNQTRVANGVPKIKWSQDCLEQAQKHANYMATNEIMVHRMPLSTGITEWEKIAENVCQAKNATKKGCFTSLVRSPRHFENIVNAEYTYMGIGVSCSTTWCYMCQIFKSV